MGGRDLWPVTGGAGPSSSRPSLLTLSCGLAGMSSSAQLALAASAPYGAVNSREGGRAGARQRRRRSRVVSIYAQSVAITSASAGAWPRVSRPALCAYDLPTLGVGEHRHSCISSSHAAAALRHVGIRARRRDLRMLISSTKGQPTYRITRSDARILLRFPTTGGVANSEPADTCDGHRARTDENSEFLISVMVDAISPIDKSMSITMGNRTACSAFIDWRSNS